MNMSQFSKSSYIIFSRFLWMLGITFLIYPGTIGYSRILSPVLGYLFFNSM